MYALANIAICRADNSCQYQQSSQTGARSSRHSVRPTIHTESWLKDCQVNKLFLLIDNLAASKIGSQQNGQIGKKFFG